MTVSELIEKLAEVESDLFLDESRDVYIRTGANFTGGILHVYVDGDNDVIISYNGGIAEP